MKERGGKVGGHHGHGGGRGCHGGGHHGHVMKGSRHDHHSCGEHHIVRNSCGGCHGHDVCSVGRHGGHHAHKRGPHGHGGGGLGCHGGKHHKHGGHGRRDRGHYLYMVIVEGNTTTPEIGEAGVTIEEIPTNAPPEIGTTAGEIPSNAT